MVNTLRIVIDGELRELVASVDTSGDGRADTAVVQLDGATYRLTDVDGDGLPDVIRVVQRDGSRQLMVLDEATHRFRTLSDSGAPDDSIEEGASHWFAQATDFTCGPAAITMVLADLFDLRLSDESEVWQRAIELQAISQDGMRPRELEAVLRSYGVPADLIQADTQSLEHLLEQGHEVIMLIDAHEYWPGFDGRGENDVLRKMPHAVRLLGICHVTETAVVSDSGRDDPLFSRLEIPLDVFIDAWEDLEWLALVTQVTHGEVRARLQREGHAFSALSDLTPATENRRRREPLTAVFLPFAVRLQRLLTALRRQQNASSNRR